MSFFSYPLTVQGQDIDALKHVNNEVYLKWLLQAASAHSSALGYPMKRYLEEGACFVVRRHEIDYLAPAYLNEELVIETWVKEMENIRSKRAYRIRRMSDQRILVAAETTWVYVNMTTGRPMEIPSSILENFKPSNG